MRKLSFAVFLCLALIVIGAQGAIAQDARPTPLAATAAPTAAATQSNGTLNIPMGTRFRIKASLSFGWLRATPRSDGATVATLKPGDALTVSNCDSYPFLSQPEWDGAQRWYCVAFSEQGVVVGWVEESALKLAAETIPTAAATSEVNAALADWTVGQYVRVKAGVPFVLLRNKPSSDGVPQRQVAAGGVLAIVDWPTQDNVQYWWPVSDPGSGAAGWVEQNSLEDIPQDAAVPIQWTQARPPEFKDFPVADVHKGAPAPVDLTSHPSAANFRTQITSQAGKGPNFAGYFTVVEIGCGTACQGHPIVDEQSGKVYDGVPTQRGMQIELQSSLFIADPPYAPDMNASPDDPNAALPVRYFLWDGSALRLIYQEPCKVANGKQVCGK